MSVGGLASVIFGEIWFRDVEDRGFPTQVLYAVQRRPDPIFHMTFCPVI